MGLWKGTPNICFQCSRDKCNPCIQNRYALMCVVSHGKCSFFRVFWILLKRKLMSPVFYDKCDLYAASSPLNIYTISLLSLCKLIWRHWTYKMPVRYILSSVWVRLSIFSQLSIIQYMGLCVFSLPISLVMIERIYTLSYYHDQIGSMIYYPLYRVRSWNKGMRCMFLYILMNSLYDQIASWNICVLVVFAPNLALCHWHAALLLC